MITISGGSLMAAYIAEHLFNLQPCILCLYQRVPFLITLILGGIIFLLSFYQKRKSILVLVAISSITYLTNSALAFFHSGVERKWWKGFEGCSAPDQSNMSPLEVIEAIKNTPAVLCDEIPWDLFGLSMANYNVALCLFMGIITLTSSLKLYKRFQK